LRAGRSTVKLLRKVVSHLRDDTISPASPNLGRQRRHSVTKRVEEYKENVGRNKSSAATSDY